MLIFSRWAKKPLNRISPDVETLRKRQARPAVQEKPRPWQGHTAVGGGAGAASGAVGGAIAGSPGIGAAVGAASGATFGFLGGLFSPSQPDSAYVSIVNRCLAEQGYEVAGWK